RVHVDVLVHRPPPALPRNDVSGRFLLDFAVAKSDIGVSFQLYTNSAASLGCAWSAYRFHRHLQPTCEELAMTHSPKAAAVVTVLVLSVVWFAGSNARAQ